MFSALLMLLDAARRSSSPRRRPPARSASNARSRRSTCSPTTPISSLAIVLGKLLSALSCVFLLMLASIPLTALVFIFGGVGPEDLVRGYIVLFATALGLRLDRAVRVGVRRSGPRRRRSSTSSPRSWSRPGATFIFVFWSSMTGQRVPAQPAGAARRLADLELKRRPPEALLCFNPFVAQLDVICGTETGFGGTCQIIAAVTDFDSVVNGNIGDQGFGVDQRHVLAARPSPRCWSRRSLLVILSVQLVAPTRRWRIRRHGRRRHRRRRCEEIT